MSVISLKLKQRGHVCVREWVKTERSCECVKGLNIEVMRMCEGV